jgi:hypothetical protein
MNNDDKKPEIIVNVFPETLLFKNKTKKKKLCYVVVSKQIDALKFLSLFPNAEQITFNAFERYMRLGYKWVSVSDDNIHDTFFMNDELEKKPKTKKP